MIMDSPHPEHPPHELSVQQARKWLAREREALQAQLADVERGDQWSESTLLATRTASAQELLNEIDQAAQRLEDGDFGTCERCEKDIPVERLEIRPYVRFCVGCQGLPA